MLAPSLCLTAICLLLSGRIGLTAWHFDARSTATRWRSIARRDVHMQLAAARVGAGESALDETVLVTSMPKSVATKASQTPIPLSLLLSMGSAVLMGSIAGGPGRASAAEFQESVDSFFPTKERPLPPAPYKNPRQLCYSVEFTDPPSLLPRTTQGESSAIQRLSTMQVLILGAHLHTPYSSSLYIGGQKRPNPAASSSGNVGSTKDVSERYRYSNGKVPMESVSYSDDSLLGDLLVRLRNAAGKRPITVALDTVVDSPEARAAIDGFLAGKTPLSDCLASLESLTYDPLELALTGNAAGAAIEASSRTLSAIAAVLSVCKIAKIGVVPLALPLSTCKLLLSEGLGALTNAAQVLPDTEGFVASVQGEGFKRYTNDVIRHDFNTNPYASPGSKLAVSGESYFSNRILLDEVAASAAVAALRRGGGASEGLVVMLTDLARVRFGYGVNERVKRLLSLPTTAEATSTVVASRSSPSSRVVSLLLNPSAEDSISTTNQLRLSLGYGTYLPSSRPLADYVWYSSPPPTRVLTRPKNPVSREGDKPEGESSVLGAF